MNFLFIQPLLAANKSTGEDTVWITTLVLVILAASVGLWTSFRKKTAKSKGRQTESDYLAAQDESSTRQYELKLRQKNEARKKFFHDLLKLPQEPIPVTEIVQNNTQNKPKRLTRENIDSTSGIEIIETIFLINIIEDFSTPDSTDVSMRRFAFNELVRRRLLCKVDGPTLRLYALNRNNLYGKTIQCEALKELSVRTSHKSAETIGV